jgi:hypothetical protein
MIVSAGLAASMAAAMVGKVEVGPTVRFAIGTLPFLGVMLQASVLAKDESVILEGI